MTQLQQLFKKLSEHLNKDVHTIVFRNPEKGIEDLKEEFSIAYLQHLFRTSGDIHPFFINFIENKYEIISLGNKTIELVDKE